METLKSQLNTITSSLTPPPTKSISTDTYIPNLLRNNLPSLGAGIVCGVVGGGVIGAVVLKRPKVRLLEILTILNVIWINILGGFAGWDYVR